MDGFEDCDMDDLDSFRECKNKLSPEKLIEYKNLLLKAEKIILHDAKCIDIDKLLMFLALMKACGNSEIKQSTLTGNIIEFNQDILSILENMLLAAIKITQ